MTFDDILRICRAVVAGPLRPGYVQDPTMFYPHLWVSEVMRQAYALGAADARDGVTTAIAELGRLITELHTQAADQLTSEAETLSARVNRLSLKIDSLSLDEELSQALGEVAHG